MMRRAWFHVLSCSALAACLCHFSGAQAETTAPTTTATDPLAGGGIATSAIQEILNNILAAVNQTNENVIVQTGTINSLTAGYSPGTAALMFGDGPSRTTLQPLNAQLVDVFASFISGPMVATGTMIQNLLQSQNQASALAQSYPAADNYWLIAALSGQSIPSRPPVEGNQVVNAGALLDKTHYDTSNKDKEYAEQFIRYVSGIGFTDKQPDFLTNRDATIQDIKTAKDKTGDYPNLFGNSDIANYFYSMRNQVAMQSLVLDTLYRSVQRRTPSETLQGKSPLEVEMTRATQRLQGTDWYDQMKNASPAVVARENAYINAEMLHQMTLMHQEIERLNVSMVVMQVQLVQMSKAFGAKNMGDNAQASYNVMVGKPEANDIKVQKPTVNTN